MSVQVINAKNAGFCFGVKRAVDEVYKAVKEGGLIYTFGPIIHNETVVNDLAAKGVRVVETEEEIAALPKCTLIIRSHGVSKQTMEKIAANPDITCIDATCPFVQRIHEIVEKESENGAQIVIIGNAGHAEVEGTIGWAKHGATVIGTREEAENFSTDPDTPVTVVAQTTFHAQKFEKFVAILHEKGYNFSVVNTICNATHVRQQEAKEIAARADVMIVIGSESSSNSAKLFEICKNECKRTLFIQSREDLRPGDLEGAENVGITAGASTPRDIIEEVTFYVRNGTKL